MVDRRDAQITVFKTIVAGRCARARLKIHRAVAQRLVAEPAAGAVVMVIRQLLLTNHIDRRTHRCRWRYGQYW